MTAMACAAAREALLVAELDELRGTGDSPLAAHLSGCGECRARAAVILAGYASLEHGLRRLQPGGAATQVTPIGRRRKSRKYLWLPLPLAAAAALAMLLARKQSETLPDVDALARMMQVVTPLVEPPAGKQAMIIEQNHTTIVWLYDQETL